MKKIGVFVLLLSIIVCGGTLHRQEKKSKKQRKAEQTEANTKQLIDTQKYIFTGINLLTVGASQNEKYYIIVTKEVIETSFLPQYSKENNLVSGPISFYKDFEYKVENSEEGGWDIYIKIELNMLGDCVEMFLKVYPGGSADLTVYKCTITGYKHMDWKFRGYIEGPKRNGNF